MRAGVKLMVDCLESAALKVLNIGNKLNDNGLYRV